MTDRFQDLLCDQLISRRVSRAYKVYIPRPKGGKFVEAAYTNAAGNRRAFRSGLWGRR
jgi:hypothetical protein